MTALKSEQADLVVSATERFAQLIPLNIEEIFLWYFEQKGVDNPERFLMQQENVSTVPQADSIQQILGQNQNPENPISQMINKIMEMSKSENMDISKLISKIKRIRKTGKDKK